MDKKDTISLKEYWSRLNGHDWYYEYHDSYREWKAGFDENQRLYHISRQSKKHEKMYNAFRDYKTGKEGAKKPPEPKG